MAYNPGDYTTCARATQSEPMTLHRLLTPADYRRMPWKNGGGMTTEIAAWPAGAAPDAFDWRVSIADVANDGPFSRFAGFDRTIVLMAGGGMQLAGEGRVAMLTEPFEPYAFSGDDRVDCTLLGGPVCDFNLIVRRGRLRGTVAVLRDDGGSVPPARFRLCHAAAGAFVCLRGGEAPLVIEAGDTLRVDAGDAATAPLELTAREPGAVLLAVIIWAIA